MPASGREPNGSLPEEPVGRRNEAEGEEYRPASNDIPGSLAPDFEAPVYSKAADAVIREPGEICPEGVIRFLIDE